MKVVDGPQVDGPHTRWTRPDEYFRSCAVARRVLVGRRRDSLQGFYLGQFCSFRPETIIFVLAVVESYSASDSRRSAYTFALEHRRARRVAGRQLPMLPRMPNRSIARPPLIWCMAVHVQKGYGPRPGRWCARRAPPAARRTVNDGRPVNGRL